MTFVDIGKTLSRNNIFFPLPTYMSKAQRENFCLCPSKITNAQININYHYCELDESIVNEEI